MERYPIAVKPIGSVVRWRDRAKGCFNCGSRLAYIIQSFALVRSRRGKERVRPCSLDLYCAQCGEGIADYDLVGRGIVRRFRDKFCADQAELRIHAEALKKGTTYYLDEVDETLWRGERELAEEYVSSSAIIENVITALVVPLPSLVELHGMALDDEAATECYNCGSRVLYTTETKALIRVRGTKPESPPIEYVGVLTLTPWCAVCGRRQASYAVARGDGEEVVHEFAGFENPDTYLVERELAGKKPPAEGGKNEPDFAGLPRLFGA